MRQFGNKNEFGIDYQNYIEMYPNDPDVLAHPERYELGGSIYFWVKGKNLLAFKGFGPDATYSADLNVLIEFICTKFYFFVNDDPFPIDAESTNAASLMEETNIIKGDDSDRSKWFEIDWEAVNMEVRERRDQWNDNHGMLTNRDGTFLPNLYIRKVNNTIEISWDNKYPHRNTQSEVYFEYTKGVEYIDINLFKDTVISFCLDFIERFQDKYPEQMNRYRENLKKAQVIEV